MTNLLQSIPSSMKIREELERMVLKDLLGPVSGSDEEIAEPSVRDRYLAGILAPRWQELSLEDLGKEPVPSEARRSIVRRSNHREASDLIRRVVGQVLARLNMSGSSVASAAFTVQPLSAGSKTVGLSIVTFPLALTTSLPKRSRAGSNRQGSRQIITERVQNSDRACIEAQPPARYREASHDGRGSPSADLLSWVPGYQHHRFHELAASTSTAPRTRVSIRCRKRP